MLKSPIWVGPGEGGGGLGWRIAIMGGVAAPSGSAVES